MEEKIIKRMDITNIICLIVTILVDVLLAFLSYVPKIKDYWTYIGFKIELSTMPYVSIFISLVVIYLVLSIFWISRILKYIELKNSSITYSNVIVCICNFITLLCSMALLGVSLNLI